MKITMKLIIKYKWFFLPCFCICYVATRCGASTEKMAGFIVNHCMTLEMK